MSTRAAWLPKILSGTANCTQYDRLHENFYVTIISNRFNKAYRDMCSSRNTYIFAWKVQFENTLNFNNTRPWECDLSKILLWPTGWETLAYDNAIKCCITSRRMYVLTKMKLPISWEHFDAFICFRWESRHVHWQLVYLVCDGILYCFCLSAKYHLCNGTIRFCITYNKQTLALQQASEESACFLLSFFCDD